MRIVWVKPGGLWPATTGGRIRSLETLTVLSQRHEVTVLTTHGAADDPVGLRARLSDCRHVISLPFEASRHGSLAFAAALARSWTTSLPVDLLKWRVEPLRAAVSALLDRGDVDLCIADFLVSLSNVPHRPGVPLLFFAHNVEHTIWRRLAELERVPWRRAALEVEWRKMRRAEAQACQRADLTVAVSPHDRTAFGALAPQRRCEAVPTGVDVDAFRPQGRPERPGSFVFTGSMDWYPNEDAVLFFARDILPRVRARIPNVTGRIVGRNPSARLRSTARSVGLDLTGTVDDVRPYIDEAAVYVVPLRAGGGTRLKIFEALAMGKAVVSTTIGAEGLDVQNGRDLILADTPEHFADAIVGLLEHPDRRAALGRAGRALVAARYSWQQVARVFESHCESLISASAASPRPQPARR